MSLWGVQSLRVLDVLAMCGPLTKGRIAQELGIPADSLGGTLSYLMKGSARFKRPKQIYIHSWIYQQDGQRCYPRAVYALGKKPDVKRPVADRLARKRALYAERQQQFKNSSAFRQSQHRP